VTATKSWGPTPTEEVGIEVDYQVAAPTETRTPTLHRANIAHKECEWKDGDRGGLAEQQEMEKIMETAKNSYRKNQTNS
jgi:hypothetical protein